MSEPTTKVVSETSSDDRYSRLRLIPWWDHNKIQAAHVLVVGAGALGNEILKNLALLGFQNVVVVDLDRVERSNLSRAVLFRDAQVGQYKACAAAEAFRSLASGATVQPLVANVLHGCGLGLFAWADVIIAGLDNREARLWINRAAWKTSRPWIDGAIEGINGVARVFLPGRAPCYECTLGETDWAMLERRLSCNLLTREAVTAGKVPTTPTISSIIGAVEVQEAVKLIHGLPVLASRGFVFEGLNHTSYVVEYTENVGCMSHYTYDRVIRLPQRSCDLTLHDLHKRACADLAAQDVTIEFSRDIISGLDCSNCRAVEEVFAPIGAVAFDAGKCPRDGHMRTVVTVHNFSGTEEVGSRTLDTLGLPLFDMFVGRAGMAEVAYLIAGDGPAVLGPLASQDGD
jgi:molybdopterin/thiamine biosynthesis adenylyltransferase